MSVRVIEYVVRGIVLSVSVCAWFVWELLMLIVEGVRALAENLRRES